MSLLELRDVEVDYRRRGAIPVRAVAGASLDRVERGEIVGLVGESGCGKSTLARPPSACLAPPAGQVLFEDQPLTPLGRARAAARARRGCRWSSRTRTPRSTRAGASARRSPTAMTLGGRKQARDVSAVAELLERVGLSPRRRPALPARVLAAASASASRSPARSPPSPSCIVLDEPLSALDASAQAQVANLLVRSRASSGSGCC